jgi:signal transduction histidine kinase
LEGYTLMGSPVDPQNQLPRLAVSLALGVSLTLVVALLGGVWIADRAMRPVKTITAAARSISDTGLGLRLRLERQDELGELASTFDNMLDRLEAAFERQRQFTADASHELRTPLTIVELEAGRALESRRSVQDYERALQVIRSENQLMTRLVNNLLTLARMDSGQVNLQKCRVDLSEIASDVVERLDSLSQARQARLELGELPELPILGDPILLVQMLTNLVENALKHAAGTGKFVRVETGARPGPAGPQAWVRVQDNGPGIPPEHLAHLFDRFYQVDKARARPDGLGEQDTSAAGAGLGLSIAQWIARAHNTEISVTSQLGQGAIFEVAFRLLMETG